MGAGRFNRVDLVRGGNDLLPEPPGTLMEPVAGRPLPDRTHDSGWVQDGCPRGWGMAWPNAETCAIAARATGFSSISQGRDVPVADPRGRKPASWVQAANPRRRARAGTTGCPRPRHESIG